MCLLFYLSGWDLTWSFQCFHWFVGDAFPCTQKNKHILSEDSRCNLKVLKKLMYNVQGRVVMFITALCIPVSKRSDWRPSAVVSSCISQLWAEACALLVLAMLVVAVETLSGADSREGGRCFWEWDGDVQGDFVIIWHSSSAFITLDCSLHVSGGGESRGIAV